MWFRELRTLGPGKGLSVLLQELPSLPFDKLGVVSKALRGPQGREPVESVEPRFSGPSAGSLETRSAQTVNAAFPQLRRGFQRL